MSPQPQASQGAREAGARIRSRSPVCSRDSFCARLDTAQVESELLEIFREFSDFGLALGKRLEPFLKQPQSGSMQFIGAGGEAIVFFDEPHQQVIKLSGPPARSGFGWIIFRGKDGLLSLRPGDLESVLARLALFEALFPSGLAIESISEDGSFLLSKQLFIGGSHPTKPELYDWMRQRGWTHSTSPAHGKTLSFLTWTRGDFLATDVRPENALRAESDGQIYPIDFIVAGTESL